MIYLKFIMKFESNKLALNEKKGFYQGIKTPRN